MMKYRKTFREALSDVVRKDKTTAKSKSDDKSTDSLAGDKGSIEDRLRDQIALLKQQLIKSQTALETERNKMISPIPNPDTGEVPLRTGVAGALLDKKGPSPKIVKDNKKKLKMSLGKSKIEINPDVKIGQISGGIQTGTGNLH